MTTYSDAEHRRFLRLTQIVNATGAAIALALAIWILIDPERRTDPAWVFWLVWPLAALHTIEEYILPGGFLKYFNIVSFRGGTSLGPLTAKRAFWVDTIAGVFNPVIILALSAIYLPAIWFFIGLFYVNGFYHLSDALKTGRYYPGAATSLVLYIPGLSAITYFYLQEGTLNAVNLSVTFGAAVLFTGVFFWQVRRWTRVDQAAGIAVDALADTPGDAARPA